jgi:hypothetical protein
VLQEWLFKKKALLKNYSTEAVRVINNCALVTMTIKSQEYELPLMIYYYLVISPLIIGVRSRRLALR